ncbi:MAG TPA: phosphatase PAP2 family protein [Jiangellales bacterium]|nr:phosphatase PAP2 family protein [Jiangellales bacterium]
MVCAGFAALLGVLVAVSWPPLIRLDDDVTDAVTRWVGERPALVDAATILTDVLAPWPLRVVALVVAVSLAVRGQRRAAVWVVAVLVAGAVTSGGLKLLVSRARPTLDDPLLDETGYAWPSGHALAGALVAALLVTLAPPRVRRCLLPVAVVGAVAVGLSRVVLGVHWASDVVSGWLLGVAVVLAAAAVAPPYRSRDETR